MGASELAAVAQRRPDPRARRRLAGDAEGDGRQDQGQGGRDRHRGAERRFGDARDARFRARADDDPRLPHARPSARQSRPARPGAAARSRGAAPRLLRLRRGRLRPQDLHRQRARPRIRDHPRDAGDPAPHLLRHHRLRVHAHLRPRREGRGFRSASRGRTRRSSSPRRASAPSCRSWSRPRASRISSTSNIPAPSASASTAPRR